jgi:uncharacterized SAM-binding protein YcdF (DUF218 family)
MGSAAPGLIPTHFAANPGLRSDSVLTAGIFLMILSGIGSWLGNGMSFGWLACLLAGYTLCVTSFTHGSIMNRNTAWWKRVMMSAAVWVLMIGAGFFILIQSMIYLAGNIESNSVASTVLVPGAGIIRTEPSFTLAKRLDTAFAYLNAHPESIAILSGGKSHGQLASEAQVMAWYLERLGIDSRRLIMEELSSNTMENIRFSQELYETHEKQPLQEIMLITSDYHLLRAQMIARRSGLRAYGTRSVSPSGLYLEYAVREFFAIFKSMIFDW